MAGGPKDYSAITAAVNDGIGGLRQHSGEVLKAFGGISKAAMTDGALDKKTKELIALAIGISAHCDGCIGFHVRAARRHGAPREQIAETVAMCLYMGGGPSLMYGAKALDAFDQFEAAEA